MSLQLLLAPTSEPLTLDDAKLHLRVTDTAQDSLISALISAARSQAEQITRRALISQKWKLYLDRFPWPGGTDYGGWPQVGMGLPYGNMGGMTSRLASWYSVELPKPPLVSVDTVAYLDSQGASQTLTSGTDFIVDVAREPARIAPAYGKYWPSTLPQIDAVQISFTCGYADAASVPQGIKTWMLIRIGTLYENREEVAILNRGKVEALPYVDTLLDEFRVPLTGPLSRS